MTQSAYYEMCEALGSEPVESEIPIEYEELPGLVQEAITIYSFLSDRWEGMSGTFLGKDYTIVFELFNTFGVEIAERQLLLRFMSSIDRIRGELISQKQKEKQNQTKPPD